MDKSTTNYFDDLRRYIFLAWRWSWLLILGMLLGGVGAYFASQYQRPVYQTTTKVMVSRSLGDPNSDYTTWDDYQLARTYSQLIVTGPVMEKVSEKLGFSANSGQVTVSQIPDTELLELTVEDEDPKRAASIANTLVDVFVGYNNSLQMDRFASTEETLQAQIDQVQVQLSDLQAEMDKISEESLQSQQQQIEQQVTSIEAEIEPVSREVNRLLADANLEADPAKKARLSEQQTLLSQLQTRLNLYQQVYFNLTVLGESVGTGNQSLRMSQLQTTLALYQQIYSNLLNNYEAVRLARLRSTPNVVQIEQAQVPVNPIRPQPLRNAALGAAAGLIIMGSVAFLIEYLDDTLKTPEDVTRMLRLPVIGLIGEMTRKRGRDSANGNGSGVYIAENPRSYIAEAYRTLRTNLEFSGVDQPLRTLLVTSAGPSEGKTTTAINLAVCMAQGSRNVVLVDADLRRPAIHKSLQLSNRNGLTDLFRDPRVDLSSLVPWGEPEISVLTSGALPPNPAELLGSEKMERILEQLQERYDLVILDSPPFILSDAIVLSARVDGVLLVVEPGYTKIDSARAMLEQLQRAGARVVGVVLNPISRKRTSYYGKYRYYSENNYRGYDHNLTSENGSKKRKFGLKRKVIE